MRKLSIHRLSTRFVIFSLASFLTTALLPAQEKEGEVIVPKGEPVNLLADPEFKNFTTHLNPDREPFGDPKEVWKIGEDGNLHISGEGWGYIRPNDKYRDYHLVMEYTWGEKTWGSRVDRARDCGLLVHGWGKDGGFGNTWMSSIESQLIEGGSGDILVLTPRDKDYDGPLTALTCEITLDRDGEKIWTPGAEKQVLNNGRVNWRDRDPDWADVKGYRGSKEVENIPGEWNRMEVICRGDTIDVFLNGEKINGGTKASPSEGYICLQTECAELFVRRYEVWPLDAFEEKWTDADKK